MPSIKAVFFDFGGTLYDYKTLEAAERESLVDLLGWSGIDGELAEAAREPASRKDRTTGLRGVHVFPRVAHVRYTQDYWLELTFADGKRARLDFKDRVVDRGGVFAPLENLEFFKRVRVDPEIGTLVWPNEVDFCPDVLYSEATGIPIPALEPA